MQENLSLVFVDYKDAVWSAPLFFPSTERIISKFATSQIPIF